MGFAALSLQFEILWPAFLAGILVILTHIPLGREVLHRGIIFLDLAIAQIAAFGVVLANVLWLHESGNADVFTPTAIAVTAAIIGALALYQLRHLEVRIQEAFIGILFILAATGSILLLAKDPHGGERLKEILVGQILWIQAGDLPALAITYAAILLTWLGLKRHCGAWLFYPLFAITITLSTQFVGVYLVFATLIMPSLATLNRKRPVVKAIGLGILGYGIGLLIAALWDLPAGASIIWCLALTTLSYFVISWIFKTWFSGEIQN